MDLNLQDKVALITGAGSQIGFGHATAITMAKEGCDVVVNDINLKAAEQTASEIRNSGRRSIAIKADVGSSTQVDMMVKNALEEFGRIDILVNNAGAGGAGGPIHLTREEDWVKTINLLFIGVMSCTKAILPQMLERKYGKIINIASGLGRTGSPNNSVYSACKGAVITFTKSVAAEVADKGVNVNCVCPGLSTTNFLRGPDGKIHSPAMVESVRQSLPLKRLTEPQDIANMVTFLVSDVASDIVGQIISVNGGNSMI
ncbi:MAG: glucose 1-dehydrogenase [Dehalococcoidales bacterium]|nr:glucose 1-dehydrogenase [Dehalococcoidales bacterium]